MRDNLRQYRAIRDALTQGYPGQLQGQRARHLVTLAALISGIVASKSTQRPKIAAQVPNGNKPESRVKRFARWMQNNTTDFSVSLSGELTTQGNRMRTVKVFEI